MFAILKLLIWFIREQSRADHTAKNAKRSNNNLCELCGEVSLLYTNGVRKP